MSDKPDDEIVPQPAALLKDSILNSIDDNSQLKYDNESQRLVLLLLGENDLDDIYTCFSKLPNLHTFMLDKNHLQDINKLVDQLRNEVCPYRVIATDSTSSNSTDLSTIVQNRLDEEYERYIATQLGDQFCETRSERSVE
ncbi:unnamed protein product, partial [Rotaria magnacalcarata]